MSRRVAIARRELRKREAALAEEAEAEEEAAVAAAAKAVRESGAALEAAKAAKNAAVEMKAAALRGTVTAEVRGGVTTAAEIKAALVQREREEGGGGPLSFEVQTHLTSGVSLALEGSGEEWSLDFVLSAQPQGGVKSGECVAEGVAVGVAGGETGVRTLYPETRCLSMDGHGPGHGSGHGSQSFQTGAGEREKGGWRASL